MNNAPKSTAERGHIDSLAVNRHRANRDEGRQPASEVMPRASTGAEEQLPVLRRYDDTGGMIVVERDLVDVAHVRAHERVQVRVGEVWCSFHVPSYPWRDLFLTSNAAAIIHSRPRVRLLRRLGKVLRRASEGL